MPTCWTDQPLSMTMPTRYHGVLIKAVGGRRRHNFAFSLNALPRGKPTRFFVGRYWDKAQRLRILEGGHVAPARLNGANHAQKRILDRAPG
jgi:hypothetical protein